MIKTIMPNFSGSGSLQNTVWTNAVCHHSDAVAPDAGSEGGAGLTDFQSPAEREGGMTDMSDCVLAVETNGLVKTFGNNRAVDGVSLSIPAGTICGVLGPNGAGKTTIINMLATLLTPDAGNAKIFGYDVQKDTQKVRQLIGLTGQFASIDEELTARENLVIFSRLLGFSKAESKRKSHDLLEEFGLTEAADRKLSEFSGGMRRRLDLAASLISRPPLIFLDEPTTGLDPRTRAQMWQTIRQLVKNGSTVLLTTQYLDEADQLADNIIVIDKGRVVANDTPDGLKRSVSSASLRLVIRDPENTGRAVEVIEHVLGERVQITETSELAAPMKHANKLTEVLNALRDAEIELSTIDVRQPTLDDVFFALTGNACENAGGN